MKTRTEFGNAPDSMSARVSPSRADSPAGPKQDRFAGPVC
jgi:hypothetical protein